MIVSDFYSIILGIPAFQLDCNGITKLGTYYERSATFHVHLFTSRDQSDRSRRRLSQGI